MTMYSYLVMGKIIKYIFSVFRVFKYQTHFPTTCDFSHYFFFEKGLVLHLNMQNLLSSSKKNRLGIILLR